MHDKYVIYMYVCIYIYIHIYILYIKYICVNMYDV